MYNTSKDKNENTNTKKKIPISANVNGLRYSKALPPNFLFEALNPNLKSLQLEFERLYRY
jgi:hypothetical protein